MFQDMKICGPHRRGSPLHERHPRVGGDSCGQQGTPVLLGEELGNDTVRCFFAIMYCTQ